MVLIPGICAAASPMQKHIHHDAAAASCLRDELRFGTWTVSQRGRAPGTGGECSYAPPMLHLCSNKKERDCSRFDYVNRTCDRGKVFSEPGLCAALRCRSLYFVGDSTVRGMFLALAGELLKANDKQSVLSTVNWSRGACYEEHLRLPRPICRSEPRCPRGVNVSYTRSNHLDIDQPYNFPDSNYARQCHEAGRAGIQSVHWDRLLEEEPQLLVLSRGAHVQGYYNVQGQDMRANAPWHAWRARTLAQRLRNRTLGVVFIKPHWGTLHSFNYANLSLRKSPEIPNVPPGPIATDHGWSLIPMIGRVTADELRQGLAPDELLVLDTTRALELRPDCRYDNLHIRPEVLAGSVLRTLVAGLVLWRGRTVV